MSEKNKYKKSDANGNQLPEEIGKGLTEHSKVAESNRERLSQELKRKPYTFSFTEAEKINLNALAMLESKKRGEYISSSKLIRLKFNL